ncbi:hypothetical protein BRADI_2g28133v3 [Brachypodium distachyon]|uniref:Uncharacterized protein n=1 Tax=Brachypodium distachyon TaxID=15368 RepID=A0A2K2DB31_BRADI|nr:hypothetical protein BRADI_2g28133v3 [Brachypodium distachyon]
MWSGKAAAPLHLMYLGRLRSRFTCCCTLPASASQRTPSSLPPPSKSPAPSTSPVRCPSLPLDAETEANAAEGTAGRGGSGCTWCWRRNWPRRCAGTGLQQAPPQTTTCVWAATGRRP